MLGGKEEARGAGSGQRCPRMQVRAAAAPGGAGAAAKVAAPAAAVTPTVTAAKQFLTVGRGQCLRWHASGEVE